MRRRGRGHGNIFGDSVPEDSLPEFDLFLHNAPTARRARQGRPRAYSASVRRSEARPTRPWVLGLRITLCSIVLVLGLLGFVVETAQAFGGYADAGTMASAPTCAAGVDPTTTTENCVGTLNVAAPGGVFDDGGEESMELDLPPAGSYNYLWPDFPGNAAFDAAVGDDFTPTVVRVEFWKGQAIAITAGDQGVTVTTDQNPNNVGGTGIGGVLMSFSFVLAGLLMFIGIRAIRLRWLRPGTVLRLFVSTSCTLGFGAFVAGVCLVNQPGRVALVAAIATPLTAGLTALVGLAVRSGRRGRVRPGARLV